MFNKDVTPGKGRKPYQKPQIERVRLVPQEAVLAVCKLPNQGSAFGGTSNCSGVFACNDLSS
jgi:hypothetical protein